MVISFVSQIRDNRRVAIKTLFKHGGGSKAVHISPSRFLQTQATQDIRRHIANCFVASPLQGNAVAGYTTLSAASIPMTGLPAEQARKLPRYPVLPAALIGRLAVDRRYQGRRRAAVRRHRPRDPR
jgi:hypothetical protein